MNSKSQRFLITSVSAALGASCMTARVAAAEQAELMGAAAVEEIVVTGTRRTDRTVAESLAPIEVYRTEDLSRQGSADMLQMLNDLNPAFNVRYFPSANGSAFVRPPTLRNLSPDSILVLVNGKRRHRSAVLQDNGGTLAGGSQGPDISQIPAIAIEAVEVLKDGASAQYGSDAIAGVINFRLRSDASGINTTAKYGQFYAGDGADEQLASNIGLPLGSRGFVNLSVELLRSGETSRGVTRPSALALAQAYPDIEVADPAQIFGNTKVESVKMFVNSGLEVGEAAEIYFFGNYGYTENDNGFNYRLSRTVTGPDASGTGLETFARNSAFDTIYATLRPDGSAVITGSTYSLTERYPGGFTPRFLGDLYDNSAVLGYRGHTAGDLGYDFSASVGNSRIDYGMRNSINPSLGPQSPTVFDIGTLEEREVGLNADFTLPLDIGSAERFLLAAGLEYRKDRYLIGAGEEASYLAGPYARVPLVNADGTAVLDASGEQVIAVQSVGSNGFPGFSPRDVVDNSRHSVAGYLDLEGDLTDAFSFGAAVRYADFSDFGSSLTGKLSARYELTPALAVRATGSTGFRAPAPAQLYTRNTTTIFTATSTTPLDIRVLPSTSPAAAYYGAKPLEPEKARNYSVGLVFTPSADLTVTLDTYQIELDRRISYSQSFIVQPEDRPILQAAGVTDYASIGLVRYFTNVMDTRTRGVDLVGTWRVPMADLGRLQTTLSLGYNETEVMRFDPAVISSRIIQGIENINPKLRGVLSGSWSHGPLSATARLHYYGDYDDNVSTGVLTAYGSEVTADLEVGYEIRPGWTVALGAENLLDSYPERIPGAYRATGGIANGQVYPTVAPAGFNGGFWYVKLTSQF